MSMIKRPGLFAAGMIFFMLLLAGLGWIWLHLSSRRESLRGQVERLERENAQLLRAGHHEAGINALQAEGERIKAWNETLRARFAKSREAGIDDTLTRAQGYFEIAAFVDKWRRRSQEKRIELKADERFGFGSFAHIGPDEEIIGEVLRQMQAMDRLLDILIAAGPDKIVSVQRVRVAGSVVSAEASEDYFDPAPGLRTGKANGLWFRVEFAGTTQTLRDVLNPLSALNSRMMVRDVVVEELAKEKSGDTMDESKPIIEIVSRRESKFTVVVEFRPWPETGEGARP